MFKGAASLIFPGGASPLPMAMQKLSPRSQRSTFSIEQVVPPALRPVFRAYILGYASSTGPRLLTLLLTHLSRRRKKVDENSDDPFVLSLFRILKGGLEFQRFPTFCAALVGGSTLLQARDHNLFTFYKLSNSLTSYRYEDFLVVLRRSFHGLLS